MNLREEILKYSPVLIQEINDKEAMLCYMDQFTDILTRKNTLVHATASSWIINKERTKILMIYHNIYKSWSWTGGHADGEENMLLTAMKEAHEETGIEMLRPLSEDIYSLELLTVDGHMKRGCYVSSHIHSNVTYLLEADDTEQLKVKLDENSGVKWAAVEETVELCSEAYMKGIYKKLNDKLALYGRVLL